MPKNTSEWQKQYKSTTAGLAAITAEAGVVVVDTTKNTLAVMDGTKAGGYPLARESVKIKSGSDVVKINGGAEADLSGDVTIAVEGGEKWNKRVEGTVPADTSALTADMPDAGLVYATQGGGELVDGTLDDLETVLDERYAKKDEIPEVPDLSELDTKYVKRTGDNIQLTENQTYRFSIKDSSQAKRSFAPITITAGELSYMEIMTRGGGDSNTDYGFRLTYSMNNGGSSYSDWPFYIRCNPEGAEHGATPFIERASYIGANSYTNAADDIKSSINRHPLKVSSNLTIYVGGTGASDTVDLFEGRGLAQSKPFATLQAAMAFAKSNYAGRDLALLLQDDCDVSDVLWFNCPNFSSVTLKSAKDTSIKTINFAGAGSLGVETSRLYLYNLKLASDAAGISHFVFARYSGVAIFGSGITMNGKVSVATVKAYAGGIIDCEAISVAGTVTGSRYSATQNGTICANGRGVDYFPGTAAGTVDASSYYG